MRMTGPFSRDVIPKYLRDTAHAPSTKVTKITKITKGLSDLCGLGGLCGGALDPRARRPVIASADSLPSRCPRRTARVAPARRNAPDTDAPRRRDPPFPAPF